MRFDLPSITLMLLLPFTLIASQAITSGPEPSLTFCPPRQASESEQAEIFEQFKYQFLIAKNLTRAYSYVAENFVQHNTGITNGRDATIDALTPFWANITDTILHSAFMNGFGWIHHRFQQPGQPPDVIFDLYRFEGSCIVEHWDALQPFPTNATSTNPLW